MKLTICHISDTHGKHRQVKVPECDILIHSGDISPLGELHSIRDFLKWFFNQNQATYKVFIAGNHDRKFDRKFCFDEQYNEVRELLSDYLFEKDGSTNVYLENEGREILGLNIWGSPITPWFHGDRWAFNKKRGEEINEVWKTIPSNTDILVTHGPPKYKLDKLFYPPNPNDPDDTLVMDGFSGCEDLRGHIKRVQPFLHLFGHIHEGYGYEYDGTTHYFNGSTCNLAYSPVNKPWLIDIDLSEKELSIIT